MMTKTIKITPQAKALHKLLLGGLIISFVSVIGWHLDSVHLTNNINISQTFSHRSFRSPQLCHLVSDTFLDDASDVINSDVYGADVHMHMVAFHHHQIGFSNYPLKNGCAFKYNTDSQNISYQINNHKHDLLITHHVMDSANQIGIKHIKYHLVHVTPFTHSLTFKLTELEKYSDKHYHKIPSRIANKHYIKLWHYHKIIYTMPHSNKKHSTSLNSVK